MSGGKTALGLDTNVGALLCYMPICAVSLIYSIIVIVQEKENKFMRFHAFQSLILTIAYVVVVFAVSIVGGVIAGVANSMALGLLINAVVGIVILAFLGLMVFGMVKGYQGQKFKLPVVGDLAEKWSN